MSGSETAATDLTPGEFSQVLGFRYVSVADGVAVVEADPGPEASNAHGMVHGGFLAGLLDTTTGWAVHAAIPPGQAAPHVQMSVQYLRAARLGSTLVCTARCTSAGSRIGVAEGEIVQDGVVIARAASTHAIRPLRPGRLGGDS